MLFEKIQINNYKSLSKIFLFVFLFLFFCITNNAQASVSLSVSPQKFDFVLLPGDSYQGQFKLGNQSQIFLPISVKALPFGAEEGTGEMIFERIDPDSPSLWFNFEPMEMILEPGEMRRINFEISIPLDVQPGGYYIFVYFEPRMPFHYLEKMGPKTIPIIGTPFLVSTAPVLLEPEQGKEFDILEFSIFEEQRIKRLEQFSQAISAGLASIGTAYAAPPEIFISSKTPSSFFVKIKNNDIYHIKPSGNLLIYNGFGQKIGEAELKGQTILPGKTRNFEINLTDEPLSFKFKIQEVLSFGRNKAELDIKALSPVHGELFLTGKNPSITFFSLTPFYYLFISVIIILVAYFGRKRIRLAFKIFLKNKT